MRFSEAIKAFLNHIRYQRNLSPRTIKAYQCDLIGFCRHLNNQTLSEISREEIFSAFQQLRDQGLESTTLRRKRACLQSFFRHMVAEGLLTVSPLGEYRLTYLAQRKLPRTMSPSEIETLLQHAYFRATQSRHGRPDTYHSALRNYLIVEVLFLTGMRIDELCKLQPADLDLTEGSVLIHGKGRRDRYGYLASEQVKERLSEYLAVREGLATGGTSLFLNRFGRSLSVHSIGPIFTSLRRSAGLKKHFTPHCLRHSLATSLIENGADLRSVQEILGHQSIATTQIYVAVSNRRKMEVMQRFSPRLTMSIL